MTKDVTTSLRELMEKASPLPWRIGRMVGVGTLEHVVDMGEPPKAPWMALADGRASSGGMTGWPASGVVHSDDGSSADNARLIVAAVNALPGLLDEIEGLHASAARFKRSAELSRTELTNALNLNSDYRNMVQDAMARALSAEGEVERLKAALRSVQQLAEVGFYLTDGCSYSGGDGYSQPYEFSIAWEWQQSKPGDAGWGSLLADTAAFLARFTEDGEPEPDLPVFVARAALKGTDDPRAEAARLSIGKGNGEGLPEASSAADAACSLRETLVPGEEGQR